MPTVDVVPATGHVPPDGNAGNGVTAPSGATCTTSFASASETSALPLGSIATASAVWPLEKSNAARICGLLTGAVAAPADAPVISVRVAAAAVTREVLIGRCLIRALPLIPGNRGSGYQLNERYASHSVSTQVRAVSTWIRVVSKTGSGLFDASRSMPVSVQPRITASAPRSRRYSTNRT